MCGDGRAHHRVGGWPPPAVRGSACLGARPWLHAGGWRLRDDEGTQRHGLPSGTASDAIGRSAPHARHSGTGGTSGVGRCRTARRTGRGSECSSDGHTRCGRGRRLGARGTDPDRCRDGGAAAGLRKGNIRSGFGGADRVRAAERVFGDLRPEDAGLCRLGSRDDRCTEGRCGRSAVPGYVRPLFGSLREQPVRRDRRPAGHSANVVRRASRHYACGGSGTGRHARRGRRGAAVRPAGTRGGVRSVSEQLAAGPRAACPYRRQGIGCRHPGTADGTDEGGVRGPRRRGVRLVIIETIVTTLAADGAVNCAPMGVEWDPGVEPETIVLKPFLETATYRNVAATRTAVVNLIDDVWVFARAAISNPVYETVPAEVVRGVVLAAAC